MAKTNPLHLIARVKNVGFAAPILIYTEPPYTARFSIGSFLMRRSPVLAAIAATLLTACVGAAEAQQPAQRVQVGVLQCRGGASIGFIVGSVTNLGCVLRIEGMSEDRYVATIRKVGL